MELPKEKTVTEPLPKAKYNTENIPEEWSTAIFTELNTGYTLMGDREIYIVDQTNFKSTKGNKEMVTVGTLDNFTGSLPYLKKLDEGQLQLAETLTGTKPETSGSKYSDYIAFKAISSGTIFMGVFLGIAFLMMMASVLMFKLLSGANADAQRCGMLRKIGVRKSLLSKSIYKELFLVFLFPALVGLVHVIVGMHLFSFILIEPYTKIWIPISIFLVIYGIYYICTVQMYKRIVLPKEY